ncbi:WD repeat-containing protein DDB_G0292056 [Stomoxys calcitrans]|uniref:Uncharacterized protein n=1 Tax=Stomoxys calcitrans TaxID=35570 RepID=A0A1I8P4E9_STOCA|nr:WD repeat-containing protein DDB_G0292056 [Stomoxys calcitrans]
MLSYVIPAQETSASNGGRGATSHQGDVGEAQAGPLLSSPRNSLSLRLNSQYMAGADSHTEVDALLANVNVASAGGHEYYDDERTHLLNDTNHTSSTPVVKRQNSNGSNSNNNNSFSLNNNRRNSNGSSGAGGGALAEATATSAEGCGDDVVNVNVCGIAEETFSTDAIASHQHQHSAATDVSNKLPAQPEESQNPRQQTIAANTKKPKLSKLGSNKTVGLKRVSFGSSKGSMVETLVFETPTPLSEHVEPSFGFGSDGDYKSNMDDSGIEVQEESERSIVRVSIYQSSKPQQICPPEYFTKFEDNLDNSLSNYNCNLDDIMTTASPIPGYDRQQSTDSGWDNPFRPGGDLSREADEIVKMISGGKPITPTEDNAIANGKSQSNGTSNGTVVTEDITKSNVSQNQSAQNGTHRVQPTAAAAGGGGGAAAKPTENNGVTSLAQVSKQVVPGPTSASHVVIDEKKNKKKGCCVIQ